MVSGVLSVKQRAFAHHYSASHNSAEAARAAGYSVGRARRTGYELLLEGVRDGRKHNAAIWFSSQHPDTEGPTSPSR